MALLNSKSPWRSSLGIKQLSCRFARTSGRWPAGPIYARKTPGHEEIIQPIQANCPVSLSKVMAEAVCIVVEGNAN